MKANYRVNRIPVTDDIRKTVFDLISKENDIANKKKHPAKWYKTETAKVLKLSENANPSLRSYEDLVNEIRNYLKIKNPLDEPWSYGSLINYPIPQDKIIEVWRLCENFRTGGPSIDIPMEAGTIPVQWYKASGIKWLTIREVRWYIILASLPLGFEPNGVVPSTEIHTRAAVMTALTYAKLERQCELVKKRFITIELDSDTLGKIGDKNRDLAPLFQRNDEYLAHKKIQ